MLAHEAGFYRPPKRPVLLPDPPNVYFGEGNEIPMSPIENPKVKESGTPLPIARQFLRTSITAKVFTEPRMSMKNQVVSGEVGVSRRWGQKIKSLKNNQLCRSIVG
jgi:hypothetical protein